MPKLAEKYTDGLCMEDFKVIREISRYNYNYYVGYDEDLLFSRSDDDNTTSWWLIRGESSFYIGESYTSQGEKLQRYAIRPT